MRIRTRKSGSVEVFLLSVEHRETRNFIKKNGRPVAGRPGWYSLSERNWKRKPTIQSGNDAWKEQ